MSSFLSAAYRKERTWNNFRPDVMKSGLQKYIRRGILEKALYCAGELDLMKHTPESAGGARAEGIRTNFIHRLMVIYVEDVGIANLGLWSVLDAQIFGLLKERKKADRSFDAEETEISNIVRELAASQKSRSCSHLRAATLVDDPLSQQVLRENLMEFPTVAALHAAWSQESAGKTETFADLCEGLKTALAARSFTALIWADRIASADAVVSEYRKRKPVWRVFRILQDALPAEYKPLHALAMRWYSELDSLKEAKLCWMLLILACVQHPPVAVAGAADAGAAAGAAAGGSWSANRAGTPFVIDDFVEDRHTAKGRNKSLTEFALVGAHVENESVFVIQEFKKFYEKVKFAMDKGGVAKSSASSAASTASNASSVRTRPTLPVMPRIEIPTAPTASSVPNETEAYEFLVRTQITTSGFKLDVYFATEQATGEFVVVKGPFKTTKEIENMLEVQEWKKSQGIPFCEAKMVYLIPDRWPEGIPLGFRNKINRSKPAPFLVCSSFISRESIHTKDHSSKVWPATQVVDWSRVPLHFDIDKAAKCNTQMRTYVEGLLTRYLFGIGDMADRNFLVVGDIVHSIDEETRGKQVNFVTELRKNKCAKVHKWLTANVESLRVERWGLTANDCLNLFDTTA